MNFINNIKLFTMRNSDKILLGLGIGLVGGSVVTTARATVKAQENLKEFNKQIADIKAAMNNEENIKNGIVNVEEEKKKLHKTYLKAGLKLADNYFWPAMLFTSGVGCICGSYSIVNQRLASTSAALSMTTAAFDKYRNRVKNELGVDKEMMLYKNQIEKEIASDDGKKKTKVISQVDDTTLDYNQIVWGLSTTKDIYITDDNSNIDVLIQKEDRATWRLRAKGYINALEFIEQELCVDISKLPPQQVLALSNAYWFYDPEDREINDFVSLGLRDPNTGELTREAKEMSLGMRDDIILTLNLAGNGVAGPRKFTDYVNRKKVGR